MNDADLARAVMDGDEFAFRTLYRRHTPALEPFLIRILGSEGDEVKDVLQETWIRAVESLGSFRWESSLRTWLTGIALNRAREVLRKRARRREAPEEAGHRRGSDRPEPVGLRIDLERAVRTLPDGYRTVLVLHDLEGFTHPEIGERLGITAGTSRSQLFHARRQLRELLGGSITSSTELPASSVRNRPSEEPTQER